MLSMVRNSNECVVVHCSILLGFLELINNMLTSGMVPALFPDEEKEAIIGQVCGCTSFVCTPFGILLVCHKYWEFMD